MPRKGKELELLVKKLEMIVLPTGAEIKSIEAKNEIEIIPKSKK